MKHITEAQRLKAQELWNQFNLDILAEGMILRYDHTIGTFYVCDTGLFPDMVGDKDAITAEEYKQVVTEGSFDKNAMNNPPWFSDGDSYTLGCND